MTRIAATHNNRFLAFEIGARVAKSVSFEVVNAFDLRE